jgi:diguanylate cyclase (GGDEF)-like protein
MSVAAVLLGMSTARTDPNAVWVFYLNFLPAVFAGIGLFTLLGFTLDAVRDSTELALTDGLTGLLNRRAFDRELIVACARAERYQRDLTLIVLDIDHFKRLNDSYGHPAGDAVIRTVAMVLEEQSRRIDVAARIGGEEFALILPDTPPAAALRLAERLRQAVGRSGNEAIAYTASFGVASAHEAGTHADALLQAADDALYAAKAAGRNCVRYAADPEREPAALIGAVH